ncbi:cysteine synthase A [Aliidiomarina haloalkalitolerans]|uniref:Cysteine synthase n=1 Tax=Aliidiomarina haloalkalitolerans TaxID=859059 RepID=A0A432VS86_9GAMM|nr:cysteine synthase A [Aliidiomarina haloalkalitolerans]RUO19204.1 cysteine synthase A [Aliidiomarina haloalkalitolerans]
MTFPSVFENNADSIGFTPLVRLNRVLSSDAKARVYAKMESRNPAGSVKDRLGLGLVREAERSGALSANQELIEATSGNTGIALASVAAAKGYKVTLVMPRSASLERRKLMKALGATIVLTPAENGMKGALAKVAELMAAEPGRYYFTRQFENPANPAIHEETTGPEIHASLQGQVDVFVAGVGTGGTLTGVGRYFKKQGQPLAIWAVEAADSPLISQTIAGSELTHVPHKIQGISAGFVPQNLDLSLITGTQQVTNDEAYAMAHRLMREEGILAGISSGAAVVAANRIACLPEYAGKTIVVVLPSSAERYLSTPLFKDLFTAEELEP